MTMRRFSRLLLVAVPCIALLLWLLFPRERLLIPRSTRYTSTESWTYQGATGSLRTYSWLSDHEALHSSPAESAPGMRLMYRDVLKPLDTEPAGLNDLIRETCIAPPNWSVAPGGHGVSWPLRGTDDPVLRARFDPVTGETGPVFKSSSPIAAGWLDSERWVCFRWKKGHGMKSSEPVLLSWVFSMDSSRPAKVSIVSPEVSYAASRTAVSIRSASGKLFSFVEADRGGDRTPYLAVESVPPQVGEPHKYPISFPDGWRYGGLWVSPSGSKLLWLLNAGPRPRAPDWARRFLPWLRGDFPAATGLWLSDPDGSNMREIGHVHQDPNLINLDQIHWIPGDKRVSYLHGDGLYGVDVE